MAFDRLADFIIAHPKAIIAIWIAVLVASSPLALKVGEVMNYDTNDMADPDSESVKGLVILDKYFVSTGDDLSNSPIIVVHYTDAAGLPQAEEFSSLLSTKLLEYRDDQGHAKLSSVSQLPAESASDGSGIVMIMVVYGPAYDIEGVFDDTPELRGFIGAVMDDFSEGRDIVISEFLTGTPAVSYDMQVGSMEDISRIDPFTVLLILLLVGLFFRSFVTSATPPVTIGFAFIVTLGLIFIVGQMLDIFFITEMMLLVSMMGAGCDYCIFIIARYREELRAGKSHTESLHAAVTWAGESIATSGASVIIGFGAMSICSFSLVSTLGICLALGILIALLAALTLIPAILAIVGDRVFWPSKMDSFAEGGKSTRGWYAACGRIGARYFEHSARFSIGHAKAIVLVTILVSVPATYVAVTSETSYDMVSSMETGESGEGVDLITEYTSAGLLMPDFVILEYDQDVATIDSMKLDPIPISMQVLHWNDHWKTAVLPSLQTLRSDFLADHNVAEVDLPYMWDSARDEALAEGRISLSDPVGAVGFLVADADLMAASYIGGFLDSMMPMIETYVKLANPGMTEEQVVEASYSLVLMGAGPIIDYIVNVTGKRIGGDFVAGGTSVDMVCISVSTKEPAMSPESMRSISVISGIVDDYLAAHPALVADKWVTGSAVVMYEVSEVISGEFTKIELLVVVLIIMLLFIVMRSYTIPFRSIFTILMSIAWTLTATHLLFVDLLHGEVMWLIPLILLVICLGLGMDYDILLTTRIKENVKARGMSNDDAIAHAVTHTGSVITVCGLIMGGAFGTLMLSGMVMMQQFGFALCFAIIVDALIVRTYIVPAIMHLLGDWNWKGPWRSRTE